MKQRISSNWLLLIFLKKVFPGIWYVIAALITARLILSGELAAHPAKLMQPLALAGFVFVLGYALVSDLADDVFDCGDRLLVRRGDMEEYVMLADIIDVSASRGTSPSRITLYLAKPGRFGDRITFSPGQGTGLQLSPFAEPPLVATLIERATEARSTRISH